MDTDEPIKDNFRPFSFQKDHRDKSCTKHGRFNQSLRKGTVAFREVYMQLFNNLPLQMRTSKRMHKRFDQVIGYILMNDAVTGWSKILITGVSSSELPVNTFQNKTKGHQYSIILIASNPSKTMSTFTCVLPVNKVEH